MLSISIRGVEMKVMINMLQSIKLGSSKQQTVEYKNDFQCWLSSYRSDPKDFQFHVSLKS